MLEQVLQVSSGDGDGSALHHRGFGGVTTHCGPDVPQSRGDTGEHDTDVSVEGGGLCTVLDGRRGEPLDFRFKDDDLGLQVSEE